jgi:hypothetical protein
MFERTFDMQVVNTKHLTYKLLTQNIWHASCFISTQASVIPDIKGSINSVKNLTRKLLNTKQSTAVHYLMNWARSNIYMNELDELTRIWKLYKLALDITVNCSKQCTTQ